MICVPLCDDVEIEYCQTAALRYGCRYYNWETSNCDYPNKYNKINYEATK
jgi:hypothetical protein